MGEKSKSRDIDSEPRRVTGKSAKMDLCRIPSSLYPLSRVSVSSFILFLAGKRERGYPYQGKDRDSGKQTEFFLVPICSPLQLS